MTQGDDSRHNLRLPPDLKRKLSHARIDSGRSMNAEIIARLDQTFEPDPAQRLIDGLVPITELSEEDRQQMGILLAGIGAILSKGRKT